MDEQKKQVFFDAAVALAAAAVTLDTDNPVPDEIGEAAMEKFIIAYEDMMGLSGDDTPVSDSTG